MASKNKLHNPERVLNIYQDFQLRPTALIAPNTKKINVGIGIERHFFSPFYKYHPPRIVALAIV